MSVSVSVSINSVLSSVFFSSLLYLFSFSSSFNSPRSQCDKLARSKPKQTNKDATVSPLPHNKNECRGKTIGTGGEKGKREKEKKRKPKCSSPLLSALAKMNFLLDSEIGRRWRFQYEARLAGGYEICGGRRGDEMRE